MHRGTAGGQEKPVDCRCGEYELIVRGVFRLQYRIGKLFRVFVAGAAAAAQV